MLGLSETQPLTEDGEESLVRSSEPPHAPSPGETVGKRYRLKERVGSGGMGVVFRAEDLKLGRPVAVKFVRTDLCQVERYAPRLRREARISARLWHPNIAQIIDICDAEEPRPYLVMEFASGPTLAEVLEREGPFDLEGAIAITLQACSAVKTAHEQGVIHRDLKPHNLILCEPTEGICCVKVLDFGISRRERLLDESEETLTATDPGGGTPHYMAPEVARGETSGDERSDVYALAAMLYEMVSGQKPHDGETRNAVLYNVTAGKLRPITQWLPDLTSTFAEFIHSNLNADPERRAQTAQELCAALMQQRTRAAEATVRGSTFVRDTPSDEAVTRRWGAAALASIVVLLPAAYWAGGLRPVPPPPPGLALPDATGEGAGTSQNTPAAPPTQVATSEVENDPNEEGDYAATRKTRHASAGLPDQLERSKEADVAPAGTTPASKSQRPRTPEKEPRPLWDFETKNPYE